ncbi:FHA domain-containing protein-like [Dorcoceras hygrometricum]|uniref:FHA domain-containing protein-like n=1 Tax=Dorcoceras hygrometricum TaxID=472368 RepID=A0A2Z7AGL6_9LAMI|nr:FHA domain-containing protein-like [Dorcoceras hygrometricum]
MPTLTRSCDQQPLRTTVLPAPATTARAVAYGPPPGPDGSNVTNLGSNRGLTRENWSLQVDAPAMLRHHDHLLVFTFILPTPDTNGRALPSGLPPDPDGSNVTNLPQTMDRTGRTNLCLFMEVRISTSYISPSSTSEGSTRRFDLTTACTDPIPQQASVRTPRLLKCTNSRSCVTD